MNARAPKKRYDYLPAGHQLQAPKSILAAAAAADLEQCRQDVLEAAALNAPAEPVPQEPSHAAMALQQSRGWSHKTPKLNITNSN